MDVIKPSSSIILIRTQLFKAFESHMVPLWVQLYQLQSYYLAHVDQKPTTLVTDVTLIHLPF